MVQAHGTGCSTETFLAPDLAELLSYCLMNDGKTRGLVCGHLRPMAVPLWEPDAGQNGTTGRLRDTSEVLASHSGRGALALLPMGFFSWRDQKKQDPGLLMQETEPQESPEVPTVLPRGLR